MTSRADGGSGLSVGFKLIKLSLLLRETVSSMITQQARRYHISDKLNAMHYIFSSYNVNARHYFKIQHAMEISERNLYPSPSGVYTHTLTHRTRASRARKCPSGRINQAAKEETRYTARLHIGIE